jgi:hypothetical protein
MSINWEGPEKQIKQINLDGYGWKARNPTAADGDLYRFCKVINPVNRGGECGLVRWFEIVDFNDEIVAEVNGKFVIEVFYA